MSMEKLMNNLIFRRSVAALALLVFSSIKADAYEWVLWKTGLTTQEMHAEMDELQFWMDNLQVYWVPVFVAAANNWLIFEAWDAPDAGHAHSMPPAPPDLPPTRPDLPPTRPDLPPAPPENIATGAKLNYLIVRIRNVRSNLYLAVPQDKKSEGVALIQWGTATDGSQYFQLDPVIPGNILIRNWSNGLFVGVSAASKAAGEKIIQWPQSFDGSQYWLPYIGSSSQSNLTIRDRNSGLVMAVSQASTAKGASVIQWPLDGGNEQQWVFELVSAFN
jgi:hypothetical protein